MALSLLLKTIVGIVVAIGGMAVLLKAAGQGVKFNTLLSGR